jgi:hypothetical protein
MIKRGRTINCRLGEKKNISISTIMPVMKGICASYHTEKEPASIIKKYHAARVFSSDINSSVYGFYE